MKLYNKSYSIILYLIIIVIYILIIYTNNILITNNKTYIFENFSLVTLINYTFKIDLKIILKIQMNYRDNLIVIASIN